MFRDRAGRVPDAWILNYAHAVVESRISRERSPRLFLGACGGAAEGRSAARLRFLLNVKALTGPIHPGALEAARALAGGGEP